MKRTIEERPISEIENLFMNSFKRAGIKATDMQVSLLLRLFLSSVGNYFFFNPDTSYRIGFIEVSKSPDKDELFNVKIIRSPENNIVNANTLWQFYTGDLIREKQLKSLLDTFVQELINYSQAQEISIMTDINKTTYQKKEKK